MYKHILISTEGSDFAQKGVDHGLSLARTLGAKVTIVTATEPFPFHASTAGAGWVPTSTDIAGYEEAQQEFASKYLPPPGVPQASSRSTQGCSMCRTRGRPKRSSRRRRPTAAT